MMNWEIEGTAEENYERYLVPTIFVPLTDALLTRAPPRTGDRVLDIACGTGIVARKTAPLVLPDGQVAAIDISAAMLDVARTAVAADNVQIDWHEGDVVDMPFEDETFDLAFCQQALQFFKDRAVGLQEIHRVLRPGGSIALTAFRSVEETPGYQALIRVLEKYMSPEAATSRKAIFALADGSQVERLITDAGFVECHRNSLQITVHFPSPEEFMRRQLLSWKVEELTALDGDKQTAMVADFSDAMQNFVDNDGLHFPMSTHVLLANKAVRHGSAA